MFRRTRAENMFLLFKSLEKTGGVGVSSYEGFKKYSEMMKEVRWDCVVLDEGHRIKNQKSHISQYVKEVECRCRIVLTGTPMQNNLAELWNLIDFTNPNLLGKYETFKEEFEDKIKKAGYTNASCFDVEEGAKVSAYLKKAISPFVLRRSKKDVASQLPKKTEKVVFCPLSEIQTKMYEDSLNTDSVFRILQGKKNVLCGIDMLRKICNHPYLWSRDPELLRRGQVDKSSGKMEVLNSLLEKWKVEKSKVLIFSQTVIMLNIIERNCRDRGYRFLRMDGNTQVKERSALISKFNGNGDIFLFLLTTRVGGLGLNLVGASRVVIYDPDWNPSVDLQAKERVYRYGQENDVEIYKLICSNTIEEKILHTQIFKNMLDQKIFTNAKLSRFFNKLDLNELFTYVPERSKAGRVENTVSVDYKLDEDVSDVREDAILDARKLVEFIVEREGNM